MCLQSFIWESVHNKKKVITASVYQNKTGKNVCDKKQTYKMLEHLIKITKIFLFYFLDSITFAIQ